METNELREITARIAMHALVLSPNIHAESMDNLAQRAYEIADAMEKAGTAGDTTQDAQPEPAPIDAEGLVHAG